MSKKHRVVVISRQTSAYGGLVLEAALNRGLPVVGVVVEESGAAGNVRRLKSQMRIHGYLPSLTSLLVVRIDGLFMSKHRSKVSPNWIHEIAGSASVPVLQVDRLNSPTTIQCLAYFNPTVVLLAGVGILKPPLLKSVPGSSFLNGHWGALPNYRGNYVVRRALLDGNSVAVTVHLVDEGIDTGAILASKEVDLPKVRSIVDIEEHVSATAASFLAETARKYLDGTVVLTPQPPDWEGKHCRALGPLEWFKLYQQLPR